MRPEHSNLDYEKSWSGPLPPEPVRRVISTFELNEFEATATWDGPLVQIVLKGTADLTTRGALRTFLLEVSEATRDVPPSEAVLDVRSVRFMNSSCISAILGWTNAVATDERRVHYPIRILWDPDVGWERRTLTAIAAVGSGLIRLDPLP
jgi:hypothetical protein